MRDFDRVFAVPGEHGIIDAINPETDRSWVNGETLEQIRLRYPGAEVFDYAVWAAARAAEQDKPVEWLPVTEERYMDMLEVLPPVNFSSRGFQVGEACDHHVVSGRPRYASFRRAGGVYEESSRPMTSLEFRQTVTGAA